MDGCEGGFGYFHRRSSATWRAESRHSLHLRDHTLRQVEADIHAILEGGRSLNRCKLARAVMQH